MKGMLNVGVDIGCVIKSFDDFDNDDDEQGNDQNLSEMYHGPGLIGGTNDIAVEADEEI